MILIQRWLILFSCVLEFACQHDVLLVPMYPLSNTAPKPEPLVLLDMSPLSVEDTAWLTTHHSEIAGIEQLTDTSAAIQRFGNAAKGGVVMLFTKDYQDRQRAIEASDTASFIFIGDVMGHQSQLISAYDADADSYQYLDVFKPMVPFFQQADFAIANLEVPLNAPPYSGYPSFSSPPELARDLKASGIDILMTANNHCVDKGKRGLKRTIETLDSLEIRHTGTFLDKAQRDTSNLLILEKGKIKVGLLNYTYGTNFIAVPSPFVVNMLDTTQMKKDLAEARQKALDKLIVFLHWGKEYELTPSTAQIELATFLFNEGVDIIIGAHPHVLQPMQMVSAQDGDKLVVYSLGNFVSSQRTTPRDGGAVVKFSLVKIADTTHIAERGYLLTWVHNYQKNGRAHFEVLPCANYEQNGYPGLDEASVAKMNTYTTSMRQLLDENNVAFPEIVPFNPE